MPIPWAAAAKLIPWGEVIAAAPSIVKGARELWKRSGGGGDAPGPQPSSSVAQPDDDTRLVRLEQHAQQVDEALEASSALITRLAEQNERLVFAVDRLKRQLALAVALAAVALLAFVMLFVTR